MQNEKWKMNTPERSVAALDFDILHFTFCITTIHIVPGLQLNPRAMIRSSNAS
jgi:hypothetical protein